MIRNEFKNKEDLINEIIKGIRIKNDLVKNATKKYSVPNMPYEYSLMMKKVNNYTIQYENTYGIENEIWYIKVYVSSDYIKTLITLSFKDNDNRINYPLTNWKKGGIRWDTQLRQFFEREILKE